jgi:hypothetical protein
MATLHILSQHGDVKVEWDARQAEAGDPEAAAAVREAERIFREHLERGATAFKVAPGEPAVKLDAFDPQAERIVVVPRVAGG